MQALIPLDKNPGLRPIGVGEILRRIAGKVVMYITKRDVMASTGSLQVCAGHEGGAEAAIHAMHDIYNEEQAEAVLLIDAENAFNSINRKVMLHNISILCPKISTYINNCYYTSARLFIIGGQEIFSKEGTTQGDPTAMGAYALGVTPLIHFLYNFIQINEQWNKEVAFADDLTVAGRVNEIKLFWDKLKKVGPKYGYYPKPSKSHLIVKSNHIERATEVFIDTEVQITTEGQKHLGAVIGSNEFKKTYVEDLVWNWNEQLKLLCKIAEIEPQAAYAAFIGGFQGKLTYFLRTIPDIKNFLHPIDETIKSRFIPAISGGQICSDNERLLLSLPTRYGGLAIPIFNEISSLQHLYSRRITKSLSDAIREQKLGYDIDEAKVKEEKNKISTEKDEQYKAVLEKIRSKMNEKQIRLNDINQEKGVSSWLNAYPLVEHGFDLNKQQFWDSIRIRYGWSLKNLPTTCACGSSFNFQHSMNCKKGGFVTIRHNNIRDLTANMLKEVCNDVEIEPKLLPLTGENLHYRSANRSEEARLDVRARGFWERGQHAFSDIRVLTQTQADTLKPQSYNATT